jgi:hypothetical protein
MSWGASSVCAIEEHGREDTSGLTTRIRLEADHGCLRTHSTAVKHLAVSESIVPSIDTSSLASSAACLGQTCKTILIDRNVSSREQITGSQRITASKPESFPSCT